MKKDGWEANSKHKKAGVSILIQCKTTLKKKREEKFYNKRINLSRRRNSICLLTVSTYLKCIRIKN